MTPNPWTPERIDLLRKCVGEGLSCSQAAKRINTETGSRFTRNAVIGKANRLGGLIPQKPSRPRSLNAPALKTRPPKNPLGTKHRQSKPNQAPLIWGVPTGTGTTPKPPTMPAIRADARAYDQTSRKLTCIELTSQTCKFGTHEEGGEVRFCGHPVRSGSVYCGAHADRCVQATSSAKELARALRRHVAA